MAVLGTKCSRAVMCGSSALKILHAGTCKDHSDCIRARSRVGTYNARNEVIACVTMCSRAVICGSSALRMLHASTYRCKHPIVSSVKQPQSSVIASPCSDALAGRMQ